MSTGSPKSLYINCQKWTWAEGTPLKKVNFFSDAYRSQTGKKDLTDFILAKSKPVFAYQREDVDRSDIDQSLKLFGSFNTISLDLSNLLSEKLTSYFDFFNTSANYLVRYLILAYEEGKLIFQGVLSPDEIEYFNPAKIEQRETLSISIYSWEREFKEYFSNNNMLPVQEFSWSDNVLGFEYTSMGEFLYKSYGLVDDDYSIAYSKPADVLYDSGMNGDASLKNWNMVKWPHFFAPTNFMEGARNFWWFMIGYGTVKDNFDLNRFDFLKKLCNSMGWIFYFRIINNKMKFVLQNRYTNSQFFNSRSVNFSDLISYNISYMQYDQKITALKLPVVELTGGNYPFFGKDYLKGARDYVVSSGNAGEPEKNLIHFNNAILVDSPPLLHKVYFSVNSDLISSKYDFNDDDVHRYKNYFGNLFLQSDHFEYRTPELLPVDGGHNDWQMNTKARINMHDNTFPNYNAGDPVEDTDLIFTGNLGTMMFRKNGSINDVTRYITLDNGDYLIPRNYIKSQQFERNMKALLSQNSNLVIECEVNGFYPYPDEIISFTNAPVPFNNSFEILSLEADFGSKTTKYKLRKRNG